MRLFTLCPNPTVDVSVEAEHVHAYRKVRTGPERMEPGGGGINIARVLAELGMTAELVYLSGGASGRMLDEELARYALTCRQVPIEGATRIAFNVHERASGAEFRFVPEGPHLSPVEALAWHAELEALPIMGGDLVVTSGSLPGGLPVDSHARLSALVAARGARFVLDSSGEALAAALAQGTAAPFLVKPSLGELEALAGVRLDARTAERYALELISTGRAVHVAVSMGAHGAFLASGEQITRLPALRVPTHSAVGAGDSFLGAMLWRLAMGDAIEPAFAYGVAAGAAAVMTGGTELCRRADVFALHASLGASETAFATDIR